MERRTAIKSISLLTAGMALFPSCSDGLTLDLDADNILSFTNKQSIWLEAISEAILPKRDQSFTTFEGFAEFVSKMLNFEKDAVEQQSFISGYNLCTEDIKTMYEKAASKVSSDEIVSYFTMMLDGDQDESDDHSEEETNNKKDQVNFCQSLRRLSIRHITTSKEYQENILEYKLVPGAYQSCVEV